MAAVVPLLVLAFQQPELIAGRLDQVSILNPDVNGGSVIGALLANSARALGMFVVQGDTIVRHNPPGRAVFDIFMLIPFFAGLIWCFVNWRRAAAAVLLLWIVVMLGPTILADDSPHFLRAVGVLPAAVMVPAIGLSLLWSWSRLPSNLGRVLVVALLVASLGLTIKEYFVDYGRDPETGYWFEAAANALAVDVNQETGAGANENPGSIYVDRRFWDSWPSTRFLLDEPEAILFYRPDMLESETIFQPAVVYAWPHENLDHPASALAPPSLVNIGVGAMAQGDREEAPYPLYVRYETGEESEWPILASFDNNIQLRFAELTEADDGKIRVDLIWSTTDAVNDSVVSFVHLVEGDELITQSDTVPGSGYWPGAWWRPGLAILDTHIIEPREQYNEENQHIRIGLYDSISGTPYQVQDAGANPTGQSWILP